METIRLIFYIVYRYYSKSGNGKGKNTAYLTANFLFVVFWGLPLYVLLGLFNLSSVTSFIGFGHYHRWERLLGLGIFVMLPGYYIIKIFIKEDDLKLLKYDEATIKKGKIILTSYIILCFVLLFVPRLWLTS